MTNSVIIYSLLCPLTNEPKYIGQSKNVQKRYQQHLRDTKNNKKNNWIKSLLAKNLVPTLQVIDEVDSNEWIFWEQHYISLYKSWGFDLKNMTNGGEGNQGIVFSKERKQKISNFYKERWKDARYREKMSLVSKRRKSQEEINKIAKANRGKKRTQAQKEQSRLSHLGKRHTTEAKQKVSQSLKEQWNNKLRSGGWNHSNEAKIRIGLAAKGNKYGEGKPSWNKGIPMRAETKQRLSLSKKNKPLLKKRKPVLQYSLDGIFIREWDGVEIVQESTGIKHISCVCLNKRPTSGGFIWKYKTLI